jgi:hypothetical protein
MPTIDNDFIYFSSSKTEQGSFRSFAHTWTGAHAVAEAVRRLLKGKTVELHICGYNILEDNNTHVVRKYRIEKSHVQGRTHELRTVMVHGGDYAICGSDPIEMAAHLAMDLYSRVGMNQCIFRQPDDEEKKELGV